MPFKIKIMGGYYKCMKYLWRQTRALGPVWGPAGCVGRTCWGRRSSRWARSAVLWSVFGPWCRSSGRTCRGSGCTGSAASSAAREDVKRLGEKSRMRCYRRDNAERRAFGSKDCVRDDPETELQAGKITLKGIFQHLFDILISVRTDRRSLRVWNWKLDYFLPRHTADSARLSHEAAGFMRSYNHLPISFLQLQIFTSVTTSEKSNCSLENNNGGSSRN